MPLIAVSGVVIMNNNRLIRVLLMLGLLAGIALAIVYRDQFDAAALEVWISNAGVLAPILFILIYALVTILFLPGSVITLAGGALFGPVLGTFLNLTGATLGAALAFLISRYLASNWIADKAGGKVKQLINGVEGEGWRFVAFVRLVPLFPFNLLNYALGLTKIKFMHYLLASYVFMLPGAIAYTWLGYAGREAIGGGEGLMQKVLIAFALLAMVAFLPRLIGNIRRGPIIDIAELKRRIDNRDTLVLDVRTAEDFVGEQGHIDSAVNIAVEELQDRMNELIEYIERPVAIVCRTDKRSAKAALLLTEEGFHDVHVVRGGMTKWIEANLPVTH
ncbi:MAG: VTT domain-containing protein [Gammaproteobacteria bacterium]|nr:VTT domain-containing protein [Gammaproteobacteria bacterium]